MKKTYQAPALFAEEYALVEHISGSCVYQSNFGVGCPIAEAGVVFFTSEESGCNEDGISMIEFKYGAGSAANVSVEQLIALDLQCYNSFQDFTQLYTS